MSRPVEQELPEPSFTILVTQLVTQALLELGEIRNPVSGKVETSLPRARFTIDLIAVLHEKTRDNLEPEEDALLERGIYELRMKYAAKSR